MDHRVDLVSNRPSTSRTTAASRACRASRRGASDRLGPTWPQLDYGNADSPTRDDRHHGLVAGRSSGFDGFRVDVAGFLPNAFWREAVPALRASVPRRILLLAEWDDPELHRLGYDLTYGWGLVRPAQGGVARVKPAADFVPKRAVADLSRPCRPAQAVACGSPPITTRPPGRIRRFKIFPHGSGGRAGGVRGGGAAAGAAAAVQRTGGREPAEAGVLFERGPIEWKQPHAAEGPGIIGGGGCNWRGPMPAFLGRDLGYRSRPARRRT